MTKLSLLIASAMCAAAAPALAETKSYDFTDFDEVSVSAGVDANITVGGDYSIVAEGAAKDLERLEIKVRDGDLSIGRKSSSFWRRSGNITVEVSLPALSGLDVSSGAEAIAENVDAGRFDIEASSGGYAEASGKCETLEADASSGGSVEADKLECRVVFAEASSGGSIDAYASEEADGDASSGGSITIEGDPENRSKDTSSGGRVKFR